MNQWTKDENYGCFYWPKDSESVQKQLNQRFWFAYELSKFCNWAPEVGGCIAGGMGARGANLANKSWTDVPEGGGSGGAGMDGVMCGPGGKRP